jgi:hypothetical protein
MSWDAPTAVSPTLPARAENDGPRLPVAAPTDTIVPTDVTVPVLEAAPTSGIGRIDPTLPPSAPRTQPWRPRKKSPARKLASAFLVTAVVVALGGGAWFGYQALAPVDDAPPPVPLRDNPDTLIGRTDDLVESINERGPDAELLDQVLDAED